MIQNSRFATKKTTRSAKGKSTAMKPNVAPQEAKRNIKAIHQCSAEVPESAMIRMPTRKKGMKGRSRSLRRWNDGGTERRAFSPIEHSSSYTTTAGYFRASWRDSCRAYSRAFQAPGSASCASLAVESPHRQIRDRRPRKDWQAGRGILQSFVDEPLRGLQRRPTLACTQYPPRLPVPSRRFRHSARHSSRQYEWALRPLRNT